MSRNFFTGVVIGTLACLLYWYWQKSTKAEDGALDLLDRLKVSQDRLMRIVSQPESNQPSTPPMPSIKQSAEDLTEIKGVGAVFSQRLTSQGIATISEVAELTEEKLAKILEISTQRAAPILTNAQALVEK